MAPNRGGSRLYTHNRISSLDTLPRHHTFIYRPNRPVFNNIPVVTRHSSRKHISRAPHPICPKKSPLRNSPLHYLRSFLLPGIFLSIFSLELLARPRTRHTLTPNRHHPVKPPWSPSSQHSSPSRLRGNSNLGPSQHHLRKPKRSNLRSRLDGPSGILFYTFTNNRVHRSPLHNRRRNLRVNILRCNRISRTSRDHRLHLFNRLPTATNQISFYIQTPLWL